MTDLESRAESMARMYGEACSKRQAARILHRCTTTINAMLEDGRLDGACEGSMVDVRSIARYVLAPKQEDFAARQRRLKLRRGSDFAV